MVLNYKTRPKSMKKLQIASAVGQIQLINEYKKVFNENDFIAQVLIIKLIDEENNLLTLRRWMTFGSKYNSCN